MADGQGLRRLIPPLAQSDYLDKFRKELPCVIKEGLSGPLEVNSIAYNQEMPGIKSLKPVEIQNIINYITSAWGNKSSFFKEDEIIFGLKNCK
jgi:hypothetical protein